MKYLTKTYAAFLYTALISLFTYTFLGGGDFDIRIGGEFITLMDARGLLWLAFVFGLIWLLYIGQDAFLYSRKLIWFHFAATLLTTGTLCWYRAQGFTGREVAISGMSHGRFSGTQAMETGYHVLPYTGLLMLMMVAAQVFFIMHVVKGKTYRY